VRSGFVTSPAMARLGSSAPTAEVHAHIRCCPSALPSYYAVAKSNHRKVVLGSFDARLLIMCAEKFALVKVNA